MPRRTNYRRRGMSYGRRGAGLRLAGGRRGAKALSFLKKAGAFIRKHKILSKGAALYAKTGRKGSASVGKVGNIAAQLGFGHRRRRMTYRRRRVR